MNSIAESETGELATHYFGPAKVLGTEEDGSVQVPPQTGQGTVISSPRKTWARRLAVISPLPTSTLAVPETSLAKRFTTQAGVLPADSGSGGPK